MIETIINLLLLPPHKKEHPLNTYGQNGSIVRSSLTVPVGGPQLSGDYTEYFSEVADQTVLCMICA